MGKIHQTEGKDMKSTEENRSKKSPSTSRRPFLRLVAGTGIMGLVGLRQSVQPASATVTSPVYSRQGQTDLELQTQSSNLGASTKQVDAQFGYSRCVDGNTALIGASWEDVQGGGTGAVYVYVRRRGGEWELQDKLTAPNSAVTGFGRGVSLDGKTALISSDGSAFVFIRSRNQSWIQQAELVPEDGNFLGTPVSVNRDTAVVGNPIDGRDKLYAGAVYVFTRTRDGEWTQQARLTASTISRYEFFGTSVSLDRDTLLVGVNFDGEFEANSDNAYVFVRDSDGNWSEQAILSADDLRECDLFAYSVSLDGDTALIGTICVEDSLFGDGEPIGAGSAYVFVRDNRGHWKQEAKLTASDGFPGNLFGISVSLDGKLAFVSALSQEENGPNSSVLYLFERKSKGKWIEIAKSVADDWLP